MLFAAAMAAEVAASARGQPEEIGEESVLRHSLREVMGEMVVLEGLLNGEACPSA